MANKNKLVPSDGPTITDEEMALITATVAKGATPEQLKLYLYDCSRRGVHPLDKLIYFTLVSGKYTPITGIDFLLSQAAATGAYAGSDDTVFVEEDGKPLSATSTVYRMVQGQRCAFTATARFEEYIPRAGAHMWIKMPYAMLGKCSLALALRRSFPQETQGLYTSDEMQQAQPVYAEAPAPAPPSRPPAPPKKKVRRVSPPPPPPVDDGPPMEEPPMEFFEVPPPADIPAEVVKEEAPAPRRQASNGQQSRTISEKQAKRLFAIAMSHGRDINDVAHYIKETYDYGHMSEILRADYEAIVEWVETD